MKPLTIIVSFDIGEQLSFRCFPRGKTGLVDEFGFQRSKAAFHGRVIPAICSSAHGLDHSSCLDEFAVLGRGVLAAAIGMMDQAGRRLLPLYGHRQGGD